MENLNAEQIRYKMSEKQIKTALECLSKPNSSPADREKCYFMWKEPSCFSCYHEVAQNALALINLQEQRIKELGEELAKCYTDKAKLTEENAYIKHIELEAMRGAANSYKMHYERLTEENEWLKKSVETSGWANPDVEKYKKVIVADTLRKMQERLKTFFANDEMLECVEVDASYISECIDQIAKEMLTEIDKQIKNTRWCNRIEKP